MSSAYDHLAAAERVAAIAAEHALRVDTEASFPGEALEAARDAGLHGLLSSTDVGGHGRPPRAAAEVVERLARECGSTAMVLTMHYCGAAVIEAHGPREVRAAIARGEHLSTLAFSEAGSRSHFWAPLGTARNGGDRVTFDAQKSFVTSAHHATAYVWSSRPTSGSEASTLWLVPRETPGIRVSGGYDGLGLRGNDSAAVVASGASLPASSRLGDDGGGFGIMMQTVLPLFHLLISSGSIGLMEAAIAATVAHASGTRHEHMGSALRDLPTIRSYVARMRIDTDCARALWLDTVAALETGRPDAMLRVLECKVATGEAALRVLDTAMRVCGGAAYRREVGVERRFRDARASSVMAPTSDQLYEFIGRAVCGMELF